MSAEIQEQKEKGKPDCEFIGHDGNIFNLDNGRNMK